MKTVENTNQTHPWSTAPICKYWNNVELKLGRNICSHLDILDCNCINILFYNPRFKSSSVHDFSGAERDMKMYSIQRSGVKSYLVYTAMEKGSS